jgi:hypothetical protein
MSATPGKSVVFRLLTGGLLVRVQPEEPNFASLNVALGLACGKRGASPSAQRQRFRVQPEGTIPSFASIREHVERLNVSGRKTSVVEGGVRYNGFHEPRLLRADFS